MSDKQKKGNASKIVIIVLLILVIIGGATFGAMYYFNKTKAATASKPKVVIEQTYPLDEIVTNLLDDSGKKYVKVNIYIGYEVNKKLTAELDENKTIIRDAVITSIRAKKTTDFSVMGLDAIKEELIKSINPILTKGKITNIYLNDILVQ
jgi:flagellar basal body-associated protein FliL